MKSLILNIELGARGGKVFAFRDRKVKVDVKVDSN